MYRAQVFIAMDSTDKARLINLAGFCLPVCKYGPLHQ